MFGENVVSELGQWRRDLQSLKIQPPIAQMVALYYDVPPLVSGLDGILWGPWQRWDTMWYFKTAERGYSTLDNGTASLTVGNINIDKTKPTVLITSPQAKDYVRRGKLGVTWSASDSLSGLATNSGKLDGNAIKNGEEIDLFYLSIGSHTITVDATDKAGNSATASVTFRVVADI